MITSVLLSPVYLIVLLIQPDGHREQWISHTRYPSTLACMTAQEQFINSKKSEKKYQTIIGCCDQNKALSLCLSSNIP